MTKLVVSAPDSGTGKFTITAPSSNSDRVFTLPDSDGTVATAESTLNQFNVTGNAPVYACRSWVNFDGSNGNIRASGNVSSVTKIGTGRYTINFLTAMPDANYNYVTGTETADAVTSAMHDRQDGSQLYSTTQFSIRTAFSGGAIDRNFISVSFFG